MINSIDLPKEIKMGEKYDVTDQERWPNDYLITVPIRIAQHLSNAWHLLNPDILTTGGSDRRCRLNEKAIFPALETEHHISQWVVEKDSNYSWLLFLGQDLSDEYVKRFGPKSGVTKHGILSMLTTLEYMPPSIPEAEEV